MQFTPQQMAGAQRYGSQTRIGNWYEDERLAEGRFAAFTDKKDRKLLASDHRRKKMGTCMQKVPLSFSEDNTLRYGSVIQLESAEVGGILACDPFEEVSLGSQTYLSTVCPCPPQSPSPARMAFKIVAVEDPRLKDMATQVQMQKERRDKLPDVEGEVVRYGDVFHLMGDPGLRVCESVNMRRPPLYLASALKTQSLSSKISNNQAVFLRAGASSATVWQFQKTTHGKDGRVDRILGVGSPVLVGNELLLQHRDTFMALSCERGNVEPTDFGAEFEVCCENMTTNGKCLQLLSESQGRKTAAAAAKAELRANRWFVRLGQQASGGDGGSGDDGDGGSGGVRSRELPPEMTADNLLKKAQLVIHRRPAGIHCLRNALRSVDPAGNGKLDREDVRWCLLDFGLELDEEQSGILLDTYDRDNSGLVEIETFLAGLREPLSDARRTVVKEAFGRFSPDTTRDGSMMVDLGTLRRCFDAEATGRALTDGNATLPMETLDALRAGLGVGAALRTGSVALADFERYHQDLCVHAEDDALFGNVVKAAWQNAAGVVAETD
ncbi:unnamed protein product [Scytosiphon promiscuus]